MFTVDDTVAAVNRSVSNYYNINKVSLDYYAHIADATNAVSTARNRYSIDASSLCAQCTVSDSARYTDGHSVHRPGHSVQPT